MPKLISLAALLIYLQPVLIPAADRSAQGSLDDRAAILGGVIQHRLDFLNDTTVFDGCTPQTFQLSTSDITNLPVHVRAVLSNRSCGDKTRTNKVHVTSVTLRDSVATVKLSVTKGEYVHKEKYSLFRVVRGKPVWSVREMRQFDFDQFYLR